MQYSCTTRPERIRDPQCLYSCTTTPPGQAHTLVRQCLPKKEETDSVPTPTSYEIPLTDEGNSAGGDSIGSVDLPSWGVAGNRNRAAVCF